VEHVFAFLEGPVGHLLFMNIGARAVPAEDGALLIALGQGRAQEPAEGAVGLAEAVLNAVGVARQDGLLPHHQGTFHVVGVQHLPPTVVEGLVGRLPSVLVPTPVEVFYLARRAGAPHQLGNEFDQEGKFELPAPQFLVGLLQFARPELHPLFQVVGQGHEP
jgi:hypothetical protein